MTTQQTQELIDFCLQQSAVASRVQRGMKDATSAEHFQAQVAAYGAIVERLREAEAIEVDRGQLQISFTNAERELLSAERTIDSLKEERQTLLARVATLTDRLQTLVEDSTHQVSGSDGVITIDVPPSDLPQAARERTGRRRCQIPDHRKQIRSLQRGLAFAELQEVRWRREMHDANERERRMKWRTEEYARMIEDLQVALRHAQTPWWQPIVDWCARWRIGMIWP